MSEVNYRRNGMKYSTTGKCWGWLRRRAAVSSRLPGGAHCSSDSFRELGFASVDTGDRALPPEVASGRKLVLPPNLRIWATMNTSDQSLFPMDSAFKRRWDWEYMPIKDEKQGYKIKIGMDEYEWWSFLDKVNDVIAEHNSSEDKQLGYFFARPKDGGDVIDTDDFVSKVIFYLWKDVFRDDLPQINPFKYTFKEGENERECEVRFTDFYKDGLKDKLLKHFLDELGGQKVQAQTGQTATTEGAAMQTQDTDGAAAPAAAATDGAPSEDAEG